MRVVLLAGGGGTRLWPLSRHDFPKQFLDLGMGLSLLQKSVLRLASAPFITDIVVATNQVYQSLVQAQLETIQTDRTIKILVEPVRKNTAPAIALAVTYLEVFCGAQQQDTVLVLPCDHLIEPEMVFWAALEQVEGTVKEKGIVTFGIRPTKPETGYGYIQIGKKINSLTYQAVRFIEKPDKTTAEKYIRNPHFFWNAGIFLFSIGFFWDQVKEYASELATLRTGSFQNALDIFNTMPDLSIDYAIMEKSKGILLCPIAVTWSDVGSWDSFYDAMPKDENMNVKIGQVFDVDTNNSLIFGNSRLISTIGIENLIIVETSDALFISKKGESQRLKRFVLELSKNGRRESILHPIQVYPWGTSRTLEESRGYLIKKVTLGPGQSVFRDEHGEIWIPLCDKVDIAEKMINNPFQESLEFVVIKRSLAASLQGAN